VTADPFVEYLLARGDDALITAQRLGEWYAGAHDMEEDVALANIALDQLGTARLLLSYAGEVEGAGRDEDALAFLRDERQFRNCLLAELPNGDFGYVMTRLLFLSAYQWLLYGRLAESGTADERLAAIAAKARKESAYHVDHAGQWTIRLGDGTDESHRRMRAAVDELWPYTHELFAAEEVAGRAVDPATLRDAWLSTVEPVLAEATIAPPGKRPPGNEAPGGDWTPEGGRRGAHTEHLGHLLAEMQSLHRAHPGATW
jgi:ring-1,2-phenylacetyl-CoA epoxidase subunit PaaC